MHWICQLHRISNELSIALLTPGLHQRKQIVKSHNCPATFISKNFVALKIYQREFILLLNIKPKNSRFYRYYMEIQHTASSTAEDNSVSVASMSFNHTFNSDMTSAAYQEMQTVIVNSTVVDEVQVSLIYIFIL